MYVGVCVCVWYISADTHTNKGNGNSMPTQILVKCFSFFYQQKKGRKVCKLQQFIRGKPATTTTTRCRNNNNKALKEMQRKRKQQNKCHKQLCPGRGTLFLKCHSILCIYCIYYATRQGWRWWRRRTWLPEKIKSYANGKENGFGENTLISWSF